MLFKHTNLYPMVTKAKTGMSKSKSYTTTTLTIHCEPSTVKATLSSLM